MGWAHRSTEYLIEKYSIDHIVIYPKGGGRGSVPERLGPGFEEQKEQKQGAEASRWWTPWSRRQERKEIIFAVKSTGSCDFTPHDSREFQVLAILDLIFSEKQNPTCTMQNEAGEYVDMYIPRKCSASNRILSARDHASIQINLASVDESTGRMTGGFTTYAICGAIRRMGESDDCINRLAKKDGIIDKKF